MAIRILYVSGLVVLLVGYILFIGHVVYLGLCRYFGRKIEDDRTDEPVAIRDQTTGGARRRAKNAARTRRTRKGGNGTGRTRNA